MNYYAIVYMSNGEIHLKRFDNRKSAENCIANTKAQFGEKVEFSRVITKDPSKPSYKAHWIN